MSEGSGTWEGLGIPRLGEYEQVQQNPTLDMVTLTGSTGQSGDFFVAQDSDGTEVFAISSSGMVTASKAVTYTLSSTAVTQAVNVTVTSTGAFAAGANNAAYMVTGSSKSALNACFGYNCASSGIPPTAFLLVDGSSAPSYFLTVSASVGPGIGAAAVNGFFEASHNLLDAPDSDTVFGIIKILAGSKAYHILALPDTATLTTV